METPTPVSALLHAGILNAGPFLALRMAYVLDTNRSATTALLVIGGITAVFASVVLLTQPSVKVALAYSSAAHMGFMLMVCGMGLYPAALLHLVAHSFYKAHAFLASGSVIDEQRAAERPTAPATRASGPDRGQRRRWPSPSTCHCALLLGVDVLGEPVLVAVGAILVLGTTQLIAPALDSDRQPRRHRPGRGAGRRRSPSPSSPSRPAPTSCWATRCPSSPVGHRCQLLLIGLVLAAFAAVVLLQIVEPSRAPARSAARPRRPRPQRPLRQRRLRPPHRSLSEPRRSRRPPLPIPPPHHRTRHQAPGDLVELTRHAPTRPSRGGPGRRPRHRHRPDRTPVAARELRGGEPLPGPRRPPLRRRRPAALPRRRRPHDPLGGRLPRRHRARPDRARRPGGRAGRPRPGRHHRRGVAHAGRGDLGADRAAGSPPTSTSPPWPPGRDWARLRTDRVSAWAAAHFDRGQALWRSTDPADGLFASWKARGVPRPHPRDHGAAGASAPLCTSPPRRPGRGRRRRPRRSRRGPGRPRAVHPRPAAAGRRVGGLRAAPGLGRRPRRRGDDAPQQFAAVLLAWELGVLRATEDPVLLAAWDARPAAARPSGRAHRRRRVARTAPGAPGRLRPGRAAPLPGDPGLGGP